MLLYIKEKQITFIEWLNISVGKVLLDSIDVHRFMKFPTDRANSYLQTPKPTQYGIYK
jgi:hypothetical protein